MFFVLFIATALGNAPSAEALMAAWARHERAIGRHGQHPIAPTESDFRTMAAGGVAKRRVLETGPDRAVGMIWTPVDRNRVWIAILDDIHDTVVSSLREERLPRSPTDRKRLYQHLSLPWPFADRQWVIEIWNNRALVDATEGGVWERAWDLADPVLMATPDPSAVWVPMTNGSWFLVPVHGGTMVAYSARSTIGGAIPHDLVTRWAMATLDEMLGHVADRAAGIQRHYTKGHEPIAGADGIPIPPAEESVQQSGP